MEAPGYPSHTRGFAVSVAPAVKLATLQNKKDLPSPFFTRFARCSVQDICQLKAKSFLSCASACQR
jgi:hypothetical protein